MTTDRTSAPRPRPHERPAPHAAAPSPGADAFAELLGAQAPVQPQPRPLPRNGDDDGRRERQEPGTPGFEVSVEPAKNGPAGAPARPVATTATQGARAGSEGSVPPPGFGGPFGQAGPLTAAGKTENAAAQGVTGQVGTGGVEFPQEAAVPLAKLPKVPALPVPAPPAGKAATPAGWLGPKGEELKPTPAIAPAPAAAPVVAPPNGEAATPSGWRGPESPVSQAPPAPTAPVSATPTPATSATQPIPAPQTTATLSHAPTAVNALLQVAHDRGISRARINLRPVELGGIEVRLHATAAGITAHLVADSPEAAKLLAQAGDELRRNLEQRDVNLLSLEVSTTAEDRRDSPNGRHAPEADDFRSSVSPRADRDGDTAGDAPKTTTSTLELPGGLLVDVLA